MPIWILLLSLTVSNLAETDYPNRQLLIEPGQLAKEINNNGWRILDVRSAQAYAAGHVPQAMRVDGSEWAKAFQDGKDASGWSKRLSELGLTRDSKVVVYDDASNKDAARVWWILKFWGVRDVRLLHGMWNGWKSGGYEQSKLIMHAITTDYEVQRQEDRLATKQQILQYLQDKSAGIIDARTEAEFTGKNKLNNKFGGCIPGAKHLDWADLVESKTQRFKSADELKSLFASHQIDLNKPQVAHCQGGGRSSVMNFAMELMGAKAVRNYHASWGEWGNSDDVPIDLKANK